MCDTLVLNGDGTPLSVIPLSVITWQTAIRLLMLDKVRVLKEHEEWIVRSPSVTMNVPSVVMTVNYVKWNRHIKYNRANVYLRDRYTCQYCGATPMISQLTLDHVLPKCYGGKTNWINVVTSCKKCNSDKGHDKSIVPKIKPEKPSYYKLVARRKSHPITIRDRYWKNYLDWPEDLIRVHPYKPKRS